MLKLVIKNGESIHFGEEVTVRFDKAAGNRIELVIDAPKEVRVYREAAGEKLLSKR